MDKVAVSFEIADVKSLDLALIDMLNQVVIHFDSAGAMSKEEMDAAIKYFFDSWVGTP